MTKNSVFEVFNPGIAAKLMRKYTKGETALLPSLDVPSLGLIRTTYGTDAAVELLKIHIRDLFDYVEMEQGSSDGRIRELAELILERYYYINIAEFIYFIGEVKLAKYGVFYGKSGTQQLAAMLQHYIQERNRDIDTIERKKTSERILKQESGYAEYIKNVKARAEKGDETAKEILKQHESIYG